jgi:chromosome segregation ATPase
VLSETTNQLIEREIDNYTRMLEQDKRKFFRVQEGRNETIKEYSEKTKELENLLGREFKSETMKRRGEVKILERELEQGINSYNEVIANNKQLKADIDELRKEKLNQKEAMRRLTLRLADHQTLIAQKQEEITSKKEHIQLAKQDILKLKMQNEGEAKEFREEVTGIKGNLRGSKSKNYLFKRKSEMDQKNEATDTQPLVRYRLRVLISKNK